MRFARNAVNLWYIGWDGTGVFLPAPAFPNVAIPRLSLFQPMSNAWLAVAILFKEKAAPGEFSMVVSTILNANMLPGMCN